MRRISCERYRFTCTLFSPALHNWIQFHACIHSQTHSFRCQIHKARLNFSQALQMRHFDEMNMFGDFQAAAKSCFSSFFLLGRQPLLHASVGESSSRLARWKVIRSTIVIIFSSSSQLQKANKIFLYRCTTAGGLPVRYQALDWQKILPPTNEFKFATLICGV